MRSVAYTDRGSPKGIISIVPIWVAWPMTLAFSRCRTSAEVSASSEGAHAQEEATRRALMHLPAAGLEYPGDTAMSVAPGIYEEMREQTRRPDARAMEQAHEHQ
jgi:hypothetical protein